MCNRCKCAHLPLPASGQADQSRLNVWQKSKAPTLNAKLVRKGLKNARCHSHVITSALSVIKNRLSWGTKDKPQCIKGLSRDRIHPSSPL
ncbi:hypothetical protein CDAR_168541 [Caerostris darwini]|uniref:Uncharacterized protein n=1 Tax=Caerostris darwini TaxID=1538125 RepID=A0AAV4T8E1_9ARAC|nr:hypothetical protein CDAR_168541 [Caerostris darwini]